ncbi:hypothetical protein [Xanthomonas campestris]|uniref:hypothetical protein n=1 Tax=Xanthomonas campestris TaxID=339 RepID=UPI00226A53C5|nr:hypothetical protein [Xanthomonas campestris]
MRALRTWLKKHLLEFGVPISQSYLGAAFQLGVSEMIASDLHDQLDEESITAALLGSFVASMPICASAYGTDISQHSSWVRYNKNKQDGAGERDTGADFALLIQKDSQTAYFSVFQAKKSGSLAGSMDLSHISPKTPTRPAQSQFRRLHDYGISIQKKARGDHHDAPTLANLHWVNYLVYGHGKFVCCPLTSLSDVDQKDRNREEVKTVQLYDLVSQPLITRLVAAAEGSGDIDGWLKLETKKMREDVVEEARQYFTVFEASAAPWLNFEPTFTQDLEFFYPRGLRINRAAKAVETAQQQNRKSRRKAKSGKQGVDQNAFQKTSNNPGASGKR